MANEFIKYPKVGDHAIGRLSDGEKFFISAENFNYDILDKTAYEILGVVFWRKGKKVKILAPDEEYKAWLNWYEWKLTGYTLDGTDRSFILSFRRAADSWLANKNVTLNYNANTIEELAESLEVALQTDEDLVTQQWHCFIKDDAVMLTCRGLDYHMITANSANTGASMSSTTFEDISYNPNMMRYNGQYNDTGAICNYDRAVVYYRSDLSNTSYNPITFPASLRYHYPVCLPCYLGTSRYNSPSVEKCAALREKYGEGEEGWLRYMKSCMAVRNIRRGLARWDVDGLEKTRVLYSKLDYLGRRNSPAATYAQEYAKQTIPAGKWWFATPDEICEYMQYIKYPIVQNDVINDALVAQHGTRLSNNTNYWSCCRGGSTTVYYYNGNFGYFSCSGAGSSIWVRPLSLIIINS